MTIIGWGTVRARLAHNCYLCTESIRERERHYRWGLRVDGSVRTMRVHTRCHDFAEVEIPKWTNGDGCEENAVEDHIRECIELDPVQADVLCATWPDLAPTITRLSHAVASETA